MKNLWNKFKQWLEYRKHKKLLEKRLKELKENDPFIYD
jgi:hypothetical protein